MFFIEFAPRGRPSYRLVGKGENIHLEFIDALRMVTALDIPLKIESLARDRYKGIFGKEQEAMLYM
jgi:hypothetical protein